MNAQQSPPPIASRPQAAARPARWETPKVVRIEAGSAETNVGGSIESDTHS